MGPGAVRAARQGGVVPDIPDPVSPGLEAAAERLDPGRLGPLLARGRDAQVFALGDDRVARRMPDPRDLRAEAALMEHVRAAGYPVPRVWRVAPGEMVLDRVDGPTMLDDLAGHPWRVDRHARTLADLHRTLHVIDPPPGLAPHPWEGRSILHLDLHPGNVILATGGPVVIDWTNAKRGGAGADLAETWMVVVALARDATPSGLVARAREAVVGLAEGRIRTRLVDRFLAGDARDQARAALETTAGVRLADPNVSPAEAVAIRALVAREA